ncbi:MAG: choice-of-anchor D domain-containing protein [Solirubrobacteraceae bacterium]
MRSIGSTGRLFALFLGIAAVAVAAAPGASALGATDVTTAGYNNLRDDWDPGEPALSPSAVQSASFGKVFSTHLEGAIYAQPLVFENTIVVTTEKAYAYGLDPSTGAIRWKRSFGKPFKAATIGCSDLKPDLGSTSTPVIDPETGTVYMTTRLQVGKGISGARWYLQALSAATGEERPGFPAPIDGTPYNTPGVPFNEGFAEQRPALLLLGGVVYVAFASDCDITPYRGIVAGFNASSGALTTMWSDESGVGTDESSQSGIWQSGGGLVSDIPGRIILASGNGVSPQPAPGGSPPPTLSESVIGLTVGDGGQLAPSQFFAPSDAPTLDQNDEDLGSGGPIALPTEAFGTKAHPHLVVEVGKDGRIFLVDADNMGGYRQGPKEGDAVLQTLGPFDGVWGHPAAYGGQGGWVYVLESAGGGYLRALSYGLNGEGVPQLSSVATSSESFGYTSGSPLVTSNGTAAGSAVVWVVYASGPGGGAAQLRAYNGAPSGGTLALLWSGKLGKASKFSVPTAYEGRVYVGTRNGDLIAFGSSADAPVQASAVTLGSVAVGAARTVTLPVAVTRSLSLIAPIAASGVESTAGPLPAARTALAGRTAGPSTIPPAGTSALGRGVITIEQPTLRGALPAGATVPVTIRFAPAHAGPVVASISIRTTAGTRSVAISGYGSAPGLVLSAQPLDFGTIETGAGGKRLSVTFTNSWTHPERLTRLLLPGGSYTVSGMPRPGTVLAPQQSVTASVLFDPARAGSYRGRLTIASDHGSVTAQLAGIALTGVARLTVTRHLDLGTVPVGATRVATLRIANAGTVPLTITRAIAPVGPFSAPMPLPEGISLDPKTSVRVRIAFTPTTRGAASGRYTIRSTDGRGAVIVTFTGRGS